MLKKLRIKFILINMSIVTIMLCIIFSLLYISTRENLERENMQMMNSIAMSPMNALPPVSQNTKLNLPYFSVKISPEGIAEQVYGGFFDLSDKELLIDIIQKTNEMETDTGVLKEYNLRFIRQETPMGKSYVYADTTSENMVLRNLIKTFLIVGSIAFVLFFSISILLAKWAVKPVESAWNQQKQFVADASHELKTPLTVIQTDAELLHSPACSDEERDFLSSSILTMSAQMRGLVESLLELARIDSGNMKESMSNVNVSDLFMDSAMTFEPVFFEKDLLFSYEVEPDIGIVGNSAHLKQVADILLDNASKYASEKGQTKMTFRQTSPKKCLLCVSNEGTPIPTEDLQNLFKRFYRADKARTRNHSYGLGLSIAESITAEHKGRIWAKSKDGYNSFYVEFPIDAQKA